MSRAAPLLAAALAAAALLAGCSGGEDLRLGEEIHGFILGEKFEDFERRLRHRTEWAPAPAPRGIPGGETWTVSRMPDRDRHIEKARLTFVEGRLAEIVLYERNPGTGRLRSLKKELEARYGTEASSPGGDTEMAYKTYWIRGPGMSVTIRRITKKPEDELYVQYQHDELFERLGLGERM